MATTRTSPALITMLIAFIAVTVGFSIMLMKENNRIAELMGQAGETKSAIPGLKEEGIRLRTSIAEQRKGAAILRHEIERLDIELGKHRTYLTGEDVLTGVATTTYTTSVNGKPLPVSTAQLTKETAQVANARLEERSKSIAGEAWQKMPSMEELIAKRQEQLAALQKQISDGDAAYRDQNDKLTAQKEKLILDRETAVKKHNEDLSTRLTKIGKLEVEIRTLLELDLRWLTDLEPLGRILECNALANRVIINLGAKDKVMPGLLFEVFQYERGKYRTKGLVEVVEVRPAIALCRVLEIDDRKTWPLAENDYIGNPVFNPNRPKSFVVAGDFARFNRADIESFIRQTGAVVRDRLSPGTDFLVVPSKEYKGREMDRAREFQVVALEEARILRFLRTEFKPKAVVVSATAPAAK